MNRKANWKRGFTLIELMTSTTLYTLIAIVLISTLLMMSNFNRRLENNISALNNMTLAIEVMEREIKMGTNFRCDDGNSVLSDIATIVGSNYRINGQACPYGNDGGAGNPRIVFKNQFGNIVYYKRNTNGRLERGEYTDVVTGTLNKSYVTDPDININYLSFYVRKPDQADGEQTSVITVIRGVNSKMDNRGQVQNTIFSHEYMIVPRAIDG